MEIYKIKDGDVLQLCKVELGSNILNYSGYSNFFFGGEILLGGLNNDLFIQKFINKTKPIEEVIHYKKYILGVIVNGRKYMIIVSLGIFNLIKDVDDISKFKIHIKSTERTALSILPNSGIKYPDYSNSTIECSEGSSEIIKIDSYFDGNDVLSMRTRVYNHTGVDLVGEILSEIRDEKLNILLN